LKDSRSKRGSGGPGGSAEVDGDSSSALGGDGGEGVIGDGGAGGYARVQGNNSAAIGGPGGRGGLGPGQPGGDAEFSGDNGFVAGGQGGEAAQADGRGGRGGQPGYLNLPGVKPRRHMKLPYYQTSNEPGRGGDSADTPQYMARRLIVEGLKRRFFRNSSPPVLEGDDIWYDRDVVTIVWLNEQLSLEGHRWRVTIVADEYEFVDGPLRKRA
jgi:hypothetical protein